MAFLQAKNVKMSGIAAAVPRRVVDNATLLDGDAEYDIDKFVATAGVRRKRFSSVLTTSDLCYHAAEKLIRELGWDKTEIGALVFVTQNPDYLRPATACILQDRLGLSKDCAAFDVELGCSGWVYGLNTVAMMVASGEIKKALLLNGEAKEDHHDLLAGHASAATALEYCAGETGLMFQLGTDGAGFKAIIIPDGGSRHPFSADSLKEEEVNGKKLNRLVSRMQGMDVFSFGISAAPKSIMLLSKHYGLDYLESDYVVLHQANKQMLDIITRKLKLPKEKVPSCLLDFGNTSSASIPLTIVTQMRNGLDGIKKMIGCGFGVGLSWGSVAWQANNMLVSELVEVGDEQIDERYIV